MPRRVGEVPVGQDRRGDGGSETLDPLEFLARLVTHIPDKHQVLTRHHGWYEVRR